MPRKISPSPYCPAPVLKNPCRNRASSLSPIFCRRLLISFAFMLFNLLWAIFIAHGRKDFNGDGVFQYLGAMLHITGDAPAISLFHFKYLLADCQPDFSLRQITCLFMNVRMLGQHRTGIHSEFGKQSLFPVDKSFKLYSRQYFFKSILICLVKQLPIITISWF